MAKHLMKDASQKMKIEENKPEKLLVLGAGLPRTGTLSMKAALTMLLKGKCYHMAEFFTANQEHMDIWVNAIKNKNTPEQWKEFFKKEGFIAGVDFPFALFWKELSEVYPEAKVILTTRDSSKWYDSVKSSIWIFHDKLRSSWTFNKTVSLLDTRKGAGLEWIQHMENTKGFGMEENLYDAITGGPETAENFFKEWESVVIATLPPERLLVHSAKEGWEPLCKFLDLPVPDCPYPRLNDAASIRQTVSVLSVISAVLFYAVPAVAAIGATYYFAM